jgi:hypothetical protein
VRLARRRKRRLAPGEHPFGDCCAQAFQRIQIDPGGLLKRLIDDFRIAGRSEILYMFPRSDVNVPGGTLNPGDVIRRVEPDETERIVSSHQVPYDAFA